MEIIKTWNTGTNKYEFGREFTSRGHYNFFLKDSHGSVVSLIIYNTLGSVLRSRSGLDFDIVFTGTGKEMVLPSLIVRDLQKIIWSVNVYREFSEEDIERVLNER